jgi:hypothetical protein
LFLVQFQEYLTPCERSRHRAKQRIYP